MHRLACKRHRADHDRTERTRLASNDLLSYYFASLYGRGVALRLSVKSPGYDADVADNVPYLDIAGVYDEEARALTFFVVNRHESEALRTTISLHGFKAARIVDHRVIVHPDLEAVNSLATQDNVAPKPGSDAEVVDGSLQMKLPPHSYPVIRLEVAG